MENKPEKSNKRLLYEWTKATPDNLPKDKDEKGKFTLLLIRRPEIDNHTDMVTVPQLKARIRDHDYKCEYLREVPEKDAEALGAAGVKAEKSAEEILKGYTRSMDDGVKFLWWIDAKRAMKDYASQFKTPIPDSSHEGRMFKHSVGSDLIDEANNVINKYSN